MRSKIVIGVTIPRNWLNEHDDENDVDVAYDIDDHDDNNANVHDDGAFYNNYGYWLIPMTLKCL